MDLIADIMAWEREHVEKIIRKYVNRSVAVKAAIIQLNAAKQQRNEQGSQLVKPAVKPTGQAHD